MLVLKNCRIVPEVSDGAEFGLADIVVEDDKIRKVCPAGTAETSEADNVMDMTGLTVIPGLIDEHVHLAMEDAAPEVCEAFRLYHETAPKMKKYLDLGITTVRDCGSTLRVACYLRDGVEAGLIEGPRIQAAGYIVGPESLRIPGAAGHGLHITANGAEQCMIQCRKEFAAGADFIKIYATQSMSQVHGKDPKCIMTEAEIRACVEAAEQNNSYVAAHAHSTDAINTCIRCGVRTIEHATYMDDESFRLLTTTPDVYTTPTHACSALYKEGDGWNDPDERAFWENPYMIESSRRCRAGEGRAFLAGVKMGTGTDLDPSTVVKYPYELEIKKEYCHIPDKDILIQATRLAAEAMMVDDVTGQVKEGLSADLIAVEGNPDEHIEVLYKRPKHVIVRGRVFR